MKKTHQYVTSKSNEFKNRYKMSKKIPNASKIKPASAQSFYMVMVVDSEPRKRPLLTLIGV